MDSRTFIGVDAHSANAILDLQYCVSSNESLSSIRRKIDLMSPLFSISEMEQIFDACHSRCVLNPRHEMSVLIAFGYWFCSYKITSCKSVLTRLMTLLSADRADLSASVFSLQAFYSLNCGHYAQAIEALEAGLVWVADHRIENEMQIYYSGFLVANRLGRDDLALRFAYKSYESAFKSEISSDIELARFAVIVCHRFAYKSEIDVGYDFKKSLNVVEKGQSKLVLINQQFLAIGAVLAELDHKHLGSEKATRFLGLAEELGVHRGSNHTQRAFHLACAKMHLQAGNTVAARDSLEQSMVYCNMSDNNLDKEYQLLCVSLGLTPQREVGIQTLASSAWRGIEARLK